MSSQIKKIFFGTFFDAGANGVSILDGYISVESGRIVKKGTKEDYESYKRTINVSEYEVVRMSDCQFMIPGFVDCHVHAPQFPNIGVGLCRPLLEWLDNYTFPLEIQYSNEQFAAHVYDKVVSRLLKSGTTTACYFSSLHLNGTLQLVKSVTAAGQRALVGKVSMNVPNHAGYYNKTHVELSETETFLQTVIAQENDLVQPIITPRFALSCDGELMQKLSFLAERYNCRIQSHISENKGEVKCVLETYPEANSYAEVYDQFGILTNKCIMAHAVHLSTEEMSLLSARGVSVAHCPASNTRLESGVCPLRQLLQHGITVGLGTDVAGGDNASILDTMRRCMDVSTHLQLMGDSGALVTWREAFYMATLGGAKALRLDHKIGDFTVGKDFDALLIDVYKFGGPIDVYKYNTTKNVKDFMESLLERFVYVGDDRNIEKVFVKGKDVTQS